jgi:hypothetical protein
VRTWTDLASLAREPDGQAFAEALTQPWPGLWVLPLAGLVDGRVEPAPDPALVRTVLAAGRRAWQVVVADVPPAAGPQVDATREVAEVLLAVGRCHRAGVAVPAPRWICGRLPAGTPRPPGAVITGVRSRAPLARGRRATLGERLWALVAGDAVEFAAAAEDGMLLRERLELPAVQTLVALANRVMPLFPGRTADRVCPSRPRQPAAHDPQIARRDACSVAGCGGGRGWLWELEEVAGAVAQAGGEVVPVGCS